MIQSFACKDTEAIFNEDRSGRFPPDIQKRALRKLLMLHVAHELNDLRVPPGNRLESLSGKRRGQHSIRINDQWRICFTWRDGRAFEVKIIDYH